MSTESIVSRGKHAFIHATPSAAQLTSHLIMIIIMITTEPNETFKGIVAVFQLSVLVFSFIFPGYQCIIELCT